MRGNRTSGSEGGGTESSFLPLSLRGLVLDAEEYLPWNPGSRPSDVGPVVPAIACVSSLGIICAP